MNPGFVKADSRNLPQVDVEMVMQFYSSNTEHYSAEMKNIKTERASKEKYGDNAVSYVQLKRDGNICTIRAKITPEHKIHKKPYNVEVKINEEDEKILSSACTDCAASSGGCKHSVAFLFWLHRRSEEPSVTSVECYWKASKLSKVGTVEKFLSAKDMANAKPLLKEKNSEVRERFIKYIDKASGGIFDFYYESELSKFNIHHLIMKYKSEQTTYSAEDFFQFASANMGANCAVVEEQTKEQSNCPNWYHLRFGRITASKIYEAAKCKTREGSLLENIMGATKAFETYAVSRGKRLEPLVLKQVEIAKKINIKKVGLLLSNRYPVLGASPDGITEEFCVEVKCPSKEKTVENYIKNNEIVKKYYYQLQMQCFFSNKDKGLFCVASPDFENDKVVNIFEISLNKEEIENIIDLALTYWRDNVFNCLINL